MNTGMVTAISTSIIAAIFLISSLVMLAAGGRRMVTNQIFMDDVLERLDAIVETNERMCQAQNPWPKGWDKSMMKKHNRMDRN